MRRWGIVAFAMLLSACGARIVPPPATPSYRPPAGPARSPVPATPLPPVSGTTVPGAVNAVTAGVVAGPPIYSLPIDAAGAARSLAAFRLSCPALLRRADTSGLTRPADWQPACDAARVADAGSARAFFTQWFESVQIGDGRAFATGYYVPEIAGSRDHRKGFDTPVYGRPDDLVDVDLGQFSSDLKGKKIRGRVEGNSFVPYFDRAAIEQGVLGRHAPIIAWAADPIEMFFLEVQGSGILRLPDGDTMRIGYASQNGRDYTGIGALMRQRGLLGPGQASMQGITQWLRDHPDQGRDIMRENKSYVFFRELSGPPLGALNLPVAARATVAADTRFVPLGAPVFLSMDRADASGLWVAQDTGGAIKGANRVDTFWGSGDEARAIAGGMSAHGTAFLLLPMGTLARLAAEGPAVQTQH
ncbi:MAG: MltA domain-containing protein [Sphingomonas sp.]|jgi:membrane-bound lytic murein transglycosylase A|uniref:murein transglycosylase A n=1 Tax=Sphingomonas sp. TaxID=28214 RepID=UPI003566BCBD